MRLRPSPRARPPRPVADAPAAELVARAEALAKGWLLELLDAAPLSAAATLPAADFARDAPALCAAIARALSSDTDLARISPGGDLHALSRQVGQLVGATDPTGTASAVSALRAVVWTAALEELQSPDAQLVADLAERLAHVAG